MSRATLNHPVTALYNFRPVPVAVLLAQQPQYGYLHAPLRLPKPHQDYAKALSKSTRIPFMHAFTDPCRKAQTQIPIAPLTRSTANTVPAVSSPEAYQMPAR